MRVHRRTMVDGRRNATRNDRQMRGTGPVYVQKFFLRPLYTRSRDKFYFFIFFFNGARNVLPDDLCKFFIFITRPQRLCTRVFWHAHARHTTTRSHRVKNATVCPHASVRPSTGPSSARRRDPTDQFAQMVVNPTTTTEHSNRIQFPALQSI